MIYQKEMDYQKEIDFIVKKIRTYYDKFEVKRAILGMSGGKDSTIVAMLLVKALGAENVYGVMMPNGVQKDIGESLDICKKLGINYKTVSIGEAFDDLISTIEWDYYGLDIKKDEFSVKVSELSKTNVAPRLRMTTLYAIGQSLGAKVIGTGNGSEFHIGWCTKHGDMANDGLTPLLPYTCIEAYEIGKLLVEEMFTDEEEQRIMLDYVYKVPVDGLTDKSDEDNFGFSYQQLHDYQRKGTSGDKGIDDKIAHMHKISRHKRGFNPNLITYQQLSYAVDIDLS